MLLLSSSSLSPGLRTARTNSLEDIACSPTCEAFRVRILPQWAHSSDSQRGDRAPTPSCHLLSPHPR